MSAAPTVFAICAAGAIRNRRARGFYLLRRSPEGTEEPLHVVVFRRDSEYFGYVNRCPHHGVNLDWEREQFLDPSGSRLMCGKHGALFDVGTGTCIEGPCRGAGLEPIAVAAIDDELCIVGVELAEAEDDEAQPNLNRIP